MPETIKDGTGKGYLVKVDKNNFLNARSVSLTEEEDTCFRLGQAYCSTTGTTALSGTDGVILYLKNTSNTRWLTIERLLVAAQTGGFVMQCRKNDTGTPGGTRAPDTTNIRFDKADTLEADVYAPSGTSITGLTAGSNIATFFDIGSGVNSFPINGTFVLTTGNVFTVAVDADGAGTAHTGRISWVLRYRFLDATE